MSVSLISHASLMVAPVIMFMTRGAQSVALITEVHFYVAVHMNTISNIASFHRLFQE